MTASPVFLSCFRLLKVWLENFFTWILHTRLNALSTSRYWPRVAACELSKCNVWLENFPSGKTSRQYSPSFLIDNEFYVTYIFMLKWLKKTASRNTGPFSKCNATDNVHSEFNRPCSARTKSDHSNTERRPESKVQRS